jgi:hypothetical protein
MTDIRRQVFELLASHSDPVRTLAPEKASQLNSIKQKLHGTLITSIITSIREYVDANPGIKDSIVPGSVGAFLLGCVSGDLSYCEAGEENFVTGDESTDNIYLVHEQSLEHVLVRDSSRALLYFKKHRELTSDEKEMLKKRGIAITHDYILNAKTMEYVPHTPSTFDTFDTLVVVLILLLVVFAIYTFFPKLFSV